MVQWFSLWWPSSHLASASALAYTSLLNSSWQEKIRSKVDSLTELRQLVVQCHICTIKHTFRLLVDHWALGRLTLLGAKEKENSCNVDTDKKVAKNRSHKLKNGFLWPLYLAQFTLELILFFFFSYIHIHFVVFWMLKLLCLLHLTLINFCCKHKQNIATGGPTPQVLQQWFSFR